MCEKFQIVLPAFVEGMELSKFQGFTNPSHLAAMNSVSQPLLYAVIGLFLYLIVLSVYFCSHAILLSVRNKAPAYIFLSLELITSQVLVSACLKNS